MTEKPGIVISNMEKILLEDLMASSGVKFGTSGARGLVSAMTDRVCYAYTLGFLEHLRDQGELQAGMEVAIAGDLRPSTPRILEAVAAAVRAAGCTPVHCGEIATPAVTLFGMSRGIPSIMVTGSHIPDDRNGIKFNKATGEILKTDEAGIRGRRVELDAGLFDAQGGRQVEMAPPPVDGRAAAEYLRRYLDFYPGDLLKGRRIGVYQHSGVVRDLLVELIQGLGGEAVPLGRSDTFVPVDTEAVRDEDARLALEWSAAEKLDALVSTDGDGDRPLVADEQGRWLRGDVAGILCARHLNMKCVATPVSSNSAVELSGWFSRVMRTRIGSPYVVAAMERALAEGERGVAGYEANGGFLIGDMVQGQHGDLSPLPTRDAVIVILALLAAAAGQPLSRLSEALPPRYTYSDRLKDFPGEISAQRLARLDQGSLGADAAAFAGLFGKQLGRVIAIDRTDGVRCTLDGGEVVHLRPSGNAPELRCYTEAESMARAEALNRACLAVMEGWRQASP